MYSSNTGLIAENVDDDFVNAVEPLLLANKVSTYSKPRQDNDIR